jgi:hypothetical protein
LSDLSSDIVTFSIYLLHAWFYLLINPLFMNVIYEVHSPTPRGIPVLFVFWGLFVLYIVTYLGVCVTQTSRRVSDWWPDLSHTNTASYYTSQTTIWKTMSPLLQHLRLRPQETPSTLFSVTVRVTLRLAVYRQSVRLGDKPYWDSLPVFVFQLNLCSRSSYITSSLMRGWVCHLQLPLSIASAVILGRSPTQNHDHILLSQIWNYSNLEGQVAVFISPTNRVAQLYAQTWGSFSSPPTTDRVTVEVFDPASTREYNSSQSKGPLSFRVRGILRLAVYRQSVHLGSEPFESHDFFPTEHLRL